MRDLLEIDRLKGPASFYLFTDKPLCSVPRGLKRKAKETLTYGGRVIAVLNKDDFLRVIQGLMEKNGETITREEKKHAR